MVLIFVWVLPTVAGQSQTPKAIIFPRKIIWTTTSQKQLKKSNSIPEHDRQPNFRGHDSNEQQQDAKEHAQSREVPFPEPQDPIDPLLDR